MQAVESQEVWLLKKEVTKLKNEIARIKAVCGELDTLLTARDVSEEIGVSTRTLWRLIADGQFPQPIRYNAKLVRWKYSVVKQYLENL